MEEKFNELLRLCKASVMIQCNDHKDSYQTVEEYLLDPHTYNGDARKDINDYVFDQMIKMDTVICLHFYPDTPGGFYVVFHYDLSMAIDQALSILKDPNRR